MPCEACGGAVELTASEGATKAGRFREEYRCVNCGATGYVAGEAEQPATEWRRTGRVFGR